MQLNEWSPLSELLSNLIVKYADALDIDSMPDPNTTLEKIDTPDSLKKSTKEIVASDDVA